MNETLNEHVRMLAQQREYLDELNDKVGVAAKQLQSTDEHVKLRAAQSDYTKARNLETMLYELVRNGALNVSKQSNFEDRKPHPATSIKEYKLVIVDDEKKAKEWASKNAPSTLSLNKSKFNKVAKELEVDFVHNEIEYRASVSRDLSEYVD